MTLPIRTNLQRNASSADAQNSLNELQLTVSRLHGKIQQLKHAPTDDPLQRQQSEAIIELFNAVAWIQRILWPTVEQLMLGGVNTDAGKDSDPDGARPVAGGQAILTGPGPQSSATGSRSTVTRSSCCLGTFGTSKRSRK